jgi:hypothetical protein
VITEENAKAINRTQAKRLFDKGELIYIIPNYLMLNNKWILPGVLTNTKLDSFETQIANYATVNCNAIFGKTVHFYMSLV